MGVRLRANILMVLISVWFIGLLMFIPPVEGEAEASYTITIKDIDELQLVSTAEMTGSDAAAFRWYCDFSGDNDGEVTYDEVEDFEAEMLSMSEAFGGFGSICTLDGVEGYATISNYEINGAEGDTYSTSKMTAEMRGRITYRGIDSSREKHRLELVNIDGDCNFKVIVPKSYVVEDSSGLYSENINGNEVTGRTSGSSSAFSVTFKKDPNYKEEDGLGGENSALFIGLAILVIIIVIIVLALILYMRSKSKRSGTAPGPGYPDSDEPQYQPAAYDTLRGHSGEYEALYGTSSLQQEIPPQQSSQYYSQQYSQYPSQPLPHTPQPHPYTQFTPAQQPYWQQPYRPPSMQPQYKYTPPPQPQSPPMQPSQPQPPRPMPPFPQQPYLQPQQPYQQPTKQPQYTPPMQPFPQQPYQQPQQQYPPSFPRQMQQRQYPNQYRR